jgi:hypothetical protein
MNRDIPPFFSTSAEGSFANKTIRWRKPAIVDRVIEANMFTGAVKDALLSLKEEMSGGTIADPWASSWIKTGAMDKGCERAWGGELRHYAGRSWLAVPFYFAEALFYLRVLIAAEYFCGSSPLFLKDPFEPFKRRELLAGGGGLERGRMVADRFGRERNGGAVLTSALFCSLWGNRVDLSLLQIAERSRGRDVFEMTDQVLIDHSERLAGLLERSGRVDFILDNCGQELVCDLILASLLVTRGKTVHLHAKKHPIYVSDSTREDVLETIAALRGDGNPQLSRTAGELYSSLGLRFFVHDHCFWSGPLHFPDMPPEIIGELASSNLVVIKGDVNYRRLLSDRMWDPSTRMEEVVSFFPAPFAVLRTMKSDTVVDIPRERVEALDREDPDWRVNGERGMIRVVERAAGGPPR